MSYIENAEKLAAKVFRFTNNLPKRYTFKIGNPMFEHAEEAVYCCRAANKVFVDSDEAFNLRRQYLIQADAHVLHVETLLGILHETTLQLSVRGDAKPPNDNVYLEFAQLIERQRKLISGVKRQDTKIYKGKAGGEGLPR